MLWLCCEGQIPDQLGVEVKSTPSPSLLDVEFYSILFLSQFLFLTVLSIYPFFHLQYYL